jgi:hypothetical protein
MRTAGWVHRDISVGNGLRYGNRGLITDLEYAKRMDSNRSHKVRTVSFSYWVVFCGSYILEGDARLHGLRSSIAKLSLSPGPSCINGRVGHGYTRTTPVPCQLPS